MSKKPRSKSSSRKSHMEEARSTLEAALFTAGVPEPARKVLANLGVTCEILKRASMQWVLDCLAKADVALTQGEMQQLSWVTLSIGNVPLSSQVPPQLGHEDDDDQRIAQRPPGARPWYFSPCVTDNLHLQVFVQRGGRPGVLQGLQRRAPVQRASWREPA